MTTFEFNDATGSQSAVIKVIGVGGGGGNAVESMFQQDIEGVDFICLNTDAQALSHTSTPITMQLGEDITKGLGAGSNPEMGRQAAYADRECIQAILEGADMVFVTAGMGGGTGTGATPVVAEIAKEMGILTVAVVTKPFAFEGRKRMLVANQGIESLGRSVDSLITIPNNRLLTVLGKNVTLLKAFEAVNNVLCGAVRGIAELITKPGLINVDFADVRTVMAETGFAMIGMGSASGENRARLAAEFAIASPLLEDPDYCLSGARGILVNITGGSDLSIGEFEEVGFVVESLTSKDATVVIGTVIEPSRDDICVTIVATGLGQGVEEFAALSMAQTETSEHQEAGMSYQKYEKPALLRRQGFHHYTGGSSRMAFSVKRNTVIPSVDQPGQDVNVLDIPSFLRKQDVRE